MTGALVLFAKTPGISPIKTRLAAAIGTQAAEEFYRHSLRCLEELAFEVAKATKNHLVPYWAVGEQDGLSDPLWKNLDRLWTGPGDLGERMHHVYATLLQSHDHVILIGTDSPHLSPAVVIATHEHLQNKGSPIIGPAEDGGYYLFGGRDALPKELWTAVPYSVPTTCMDFTKRLEAYSPVVFLEQNFDIDVVEDILKLRHHGAAMTGQAQKALLAWVSCLTIPTAVQES